MSRTRNVRIASVLAPLVLAPLLALGCSSSDNNNFGSGSNGEFGDAGTCARAGCSADGLSYIDCDGREVACETGLACAEGKCVAACEAAKAQQSTVGCEYFPTVPSGDKPGEGSCYAVMLANVSAASVSIDLEWGDQKISQGYIRKPRGNGTGLAYDLLVDGKLGPGEIAIAFLAGRAPSGTTSGRDWTGTACPADVGAAIAEPSTYVSTGGRARAFHLTTSGPVIAYDIYPYGGASTYFPSASLLLPTSAWGKNFVAVDGYDVSSELAAQGMFPYMQVVASEDDTTVSLLPKVTLGGGIGLPDAPAAQPYQVKLARGEFLQFSQKEELNGTIVDSDKPIAVVGGNQCANIPTDKLACDALHQQLPPIALMGDTYVATRYRDRKSDNSTNLEVVPWRIVGVVDGTELRFDPEMPEVAKTINRGELIEFKAPGPFVIHTQDKDHPVYVASYMTAGNLAPYMVLNERNQLVPGGLGDPEFVNVAPAAQFLSNYVFLTDPTFGNTNLVFVRSTVGGAKDVTLDCLGKVDGWQPVGGSEFEMARVDLKFLGQNVGDCSNGAHRAWSDAPFGLTVWGFDNYASYGYVAGMSAKPLNDVHIDVPR